MSPRRQSPLTLEYVLLGLIARSPAHGYTLHKELSRLDGVGMVWQIKQSQIYALLEKLEAEEFIEAAQIESETYPPRKSYQLTEEGRKSFEHWRSTPVPHPRDLRQEFLARLYFARLAGPEITQKLLIAQEDLALAWLSADQNELASLSPSQDYELTVLHFRIRQIEASLDWLHYCKSFLEEKK